MDNRTNKQKQYPTGTRPHHNGIQISFKLPDDAAATYHHFNWPQTPANLARAGRIRQHIVDAIRLGVFRWEDHIPDHPRAAQAKKGTFADYAQAYLDNAQNDWKPQTRYKFKGILNKIWMPGLADQPINAINYKALSATLTAAVARFEAQHGKPPSVSLYNDWLATVRGTFEMAAANGDISRTRNPAAEFKNKTRVRTEPDPFDQEEASEIISNIYAHDGALAGAWFELGFFTGMRYPSEPAALTWQHVDWRKNELKINQIYSKHAADGIQRTTKTGVARTVLLNTRSRHALETLRAETGFTDGHLFLIDGAMVKGGETLRIIWRAAIKRLKIRYRDMYNMRHTYATFGLMQGANPAFMASQLGHSQQEFFKTYAKWINSQNNQQQIAIIDSGLQNLPQTCRKLSKIL
ncbi:MAG: site-specific integrase [Rhodospirillaceae bacterium]|nr:site-specific integrase [Rhodospirillaceae bacterium]